MPAAVPAPLRKALRRLPGAQRAAVAARFGDVRRTAPLTEWGEERGTAVDRWYLERFLREHAASVHGLVLEVKSDQYASSLGAAQVEVLDIDPANARAVVVGDVCDAATLSAGRYDAVVFTQTLQLVDDPAAAVRNLLSSLRPGGTLIVTVPCLSRLVDGSDRWRWTPAGLRHLLEQAGGPDVELTVVGMGNGLAARAFLFGLAAEDLAPQALTAQDDDYPLVVGALVRLPG